MLGTTVELPQAAPSKFGTLRRHHVSVPRRRSFAWWVMQTEWACLLGSGWQRWSHASRWGLSESRLSCSLLNWSTYNSLTLTVTRVQGRMWSAPSRSRKPSER